MWQYDGFRAFLVTCVLVGLMAFWVWLWAVFGAVFFVVTMGIIVFVTIFINVWRWVYETFY